MLLLEAAPLSWPKILGTDRVPGSPRSVRWERHIFLGVRTPAVGLAISLGQGTLTSVPGIHESESRVPVSTLAWSSPARLGKSHTLCLSVLTPKLRTRARRSLSFPRCCRWLLMETQRARCRVGRPTGYSPGCSNDSHVIIRHHRVSIDGAGIWDVVKNLVLTSCFFG